MTQPRERKPRPWDPDFVRLDSTGSPTVDAGIEEIEPGTYVEVFDRLLRFSTVAALLDVTTPTVARWATKEGRLKFISTKFGYRVKYSDMIEFLAKERNG